MTAEPLAAPFLDAARRGVLVVQRCDRCRAAQPPPRPRCASCGATSLGWAPASGRARLVSFAVLHRAPPEHRDRIPYVYAVVDLEEGPRMVANVVGADPSALEIGDDLEVTFRRTAADGQLWPDFRPAPGGGAG